MKYITIISILLLSSSAISCGESSPAISIEETVSNETSENSTNMNISITVGNQTITATMEDNGAARDFLSRLPLTVTFRDFNNTEKIFYPNPALSLDNTPSGCAPIPGDITIYAPWGNVAVFYKNWSHSNDLIKIGHINDNGIDILSEQNGNFSATINLLSE